MSCAILRCPWSGARRFPDVDAEVVICARYSPLVGRARAGSGRLRIRARRLRRTNSSARSPAGAQHPPRRLRPGRAQLLAGGVTSGARDGELGGHEVFHCHVRAVGCPVMDLSLRQGGRRRSRGGPDWCSTPLRTGHAGTRLIRHHTEQIVCETGGLHFRARRTRACSVVCLTATCDL